MEKKSINPIIYGLTVLVLLALAFYGLNALNAYTAPIVEAKSAGAQNEMLLGVMPEAAGFEQLFGSDTESQLENVPDTVQSVYKETSGLGYVILLSTTQGYTGDPIEFILAVDMEGKISGVEMLSYPESRDFGEDYPLTYLGQDSALADVGLVAGVTYSSSAFKNAVSDGLNLLVDNELIAAGVKDDTQLLMELLPQVFPGIVNPAGILQTEEENLEGGPITRIMPALNGSGVAYIVSDGQRSYLALVNIAGNVTIYDAEGNDLSGDAVLSALAEAARTDAAGRLSATEKAPRKLTRLLPDEAELSPIPLDGIYNSVIAAWKAESGEGTMYAFIAAPYGYSNMPMAIYLVLDESGAIVAMNADELIFFGEYFSDYELEEDAYKAGFEGLTAHSWTGEQALIAGATFSTDGVKSGTDDVFDAFDILVNGGTN